MARRNIAAAVILLTGTFNLSACSSDETEGNTAQSATNAFDRAYNDAYRTSWRGTFVPACAASARSSASTVKLDFDELCGCVADKLLATKSREQLAREPDAAEARRLFTACMTERKPV